ncbi:MAG TPA: hypothetical protein VGE21_16235, partial [Flavobacteriales bacterium]
VVERSDALSMANTVKDNIRTRRVAILMGPDGAADAKALKTALQREGAVVKVIAPLMPPPGEGEVPVDHGLMTTSSVLFDAIAVIGRRPWDRLPDARDFISDAYRHCKAIALLGDAQGLLQDWGLTEDADPPGVVVASNAKSIAKPFVAAIAAHRWWEREVDPITGTRN